MQQQFIVHLSRKLKNVRNFGIKAPSFIIPLGVERLINLPDAKLRICKTYGIAHTTPIILFLSRLHPKKRLELLLEALANLNKQYDFHLIIAGSGTEDYVQYISNLCSHLKLNFCTTFANFVEGQHKILLLQGSDIFALPSYGENFGIAVAEAMAYGLPVIVTPEVQISPG